MMRNQLRESPGAGDGVEHCFKLRQGMLWRLKPPGLHNGFVGVLTCLCVCVFQTKGDLWIEVIEDKPQFVRGAVHVLLIDLPNLACKAQTKFIDWSRNRVFSLHLVMFMGNILPFHQTSETKQLAGCHKQIGSAVTFSASGKQHIDRNCS